MAQLVRTFCDEQGRRTFTLSKISEYGADALATFAPTNQHRAAKLRQTLQFLRNDGLLTFMDTRGTYTLRGVDLLKDEVTQPQAISALLDTTSSEQEREYVREVNARFRGWVRIARVTYGDFCLVPNCSNTFTKEGGDRYIEVHHIDPLCDGGEEQIWNLSVVCAHHHRMAHFASAATRHDLRNVLIERTQQLLTRPAPEAMMLNCLTRQETV